MDQLVLALVVVAKVVAGDQSCCVCDDLVILTLTAGLRHSALSSFSPDVTVVQPIHTSSFHGPFLPSPVTCTIFCQ